MTHGGLRRLRRGIWLFCAVVGFFCWLEFLNFWEFGGLMGVKWMGMKWMEEGEVDGCEVG